MDLLLIHPNDHKAVYGDTLSFTACEPPYWCGIAAQYCIDRGYSVNIIDAEAENLSFKEVALRVRKYKPDIIGIFATGTNLSASTQKMQGTGLTCEAIKNTSPDSLIFVWGLHPSALPERTLREIKADYVVKGEGFPAIVNLIRYAKKLISFKAENFLGGGGDLLPVF